MWRSFLKTVEKSIVINSKQIGVANNSRHVSGLRNDVPQRLMQCSAQLLCRVRQQVVTAGPIDGDAEYIIPYKTEYERPDRAKKLEDILSHRFGFSEKEIENIMTDELVSKMYRQKSLINTLETLCLEGITKENIIEYPWLLTLDKSKLTEKLKLLRSLCGFREINDFVPFLRLQVSRLNKLVTALNRESGLVPQGNRVYYVAKKLNVLPCIVTKYLAKRLFVLELPLDTFKTNLQHMLSYNIEPMNLLKDLWGFRYAPRAVELRLKRATHAKKDKIMPWMVRCPETILQKSLQLSLDELEVLDGKTSVAEYVGERLGFSSEEAQVIMNKHSQVNSVRVTKIKEVLDYLLDEEKFTRHEIAQVPRILCHSLKTTKQRLNELKTYNCRPTSLVIVCRSKREYKKFLNQWQQSEESYKTSKKDVN